MLRYNIQDYIEIYLTSLGFTIGIDYEFNDGLLAPIEKQRVIEQQAVDEEGNLLFDEEENPVMIEVVENYFEAIPSHDEAVKQAKELRRIEIAPRLAALGDIGFYFDAIKGDSVLDDNHSFNQSDLSEFIDDSEWKVSNLPFPKPTLEELESLSVIVLSKRDQEASIRTRLDRGRKVRALSQDLLDLVAGWNMERQLTGQQISDLITLVSPIMEMLQANRPFQAKPLIESLVVDGILITQDMKDQSIALYETYGEL
jgi:hypothetical protein